MDRLLTAEEIAERPRDEDPVGLGAGQGGAGRIPHVRLGRYRRFRESSVEAWLRNLEGDSAAPTSSVAPAPVSIRRRAS